MDNTLYASRSFKRSWTYALMVHVVFFIMIAVSLTTVSPMQPSQDLPYQQADKIVQATSVNQAQVDQEIARLKDTQAQKQRAENQRVAALKQQAIAAENAKKAQQAALEQIKQQQLDAKQAAQDQLKQLEAIKQQTKEAQAAQAAQKQAQLKAEQLQAQKKQMQQDAMHSLQSEIDTEQTQLNRQKAVTIQNEVQKYTALITQAMQSNWQYPPNVNKALRCVLEIKLAPNGDVLSVQLLKSSGLQMLDQSAIAAVYKSSPLPVSSDPEVFAILKDISLTASPQG